MPRTFAGPHRFDAHMSGWAVAFAHNVVHTFFLLVVSLWWIMSFGRLKALRFASPSPTLSASR